MNFYTEAAGYLLKHNGQVVKQENLSEETISQASLGPHLDNLAPSAFTIFKKNDHTIGIIVLHDWERSLEETKQKKNDESEIKKIREADKSNFDNFVIPNEPVEHTDNSPFLYKVQHKLESIFRTIVYKLF